MVVDTGPVVERRRAGGHAGFRFEAAWVEEDRCKEIVKEAWGRSGERGDRTVSEALVLAAGELAAWRSDVLGELDNRIKEVKKALEECRRGALNAKQIAKEGVLRYKLDKAEEQKDLYWKQRAHVKWMMFGDRNTAFFHASYSERRRKNRIGILRKENGGWVENEVEKEFYY